MRNAHLVEGAHSFLFQLLEPPYNACCISYISFLLLICSFKITLNLLQEKWRLSFSSLKTHLKLCWDQWPTSMSNFWAWYAWFFLSSYAHRKSQRISDLLWGILWIMPPMFLHITCGITLEIPKLNIFLQYYVYISGIFRPWSGTSCNWSIFV